MTLILAFVLTFFVAYTSVHYAVTTWAVKAPAAIVIAALAGVILGVFATLGVAALVTLG